MPGNQIFQSGSYKRETSITPVHDLDVIWVMPEQYQQEFFRLYGSNPNDVKFNPQEALNNLKDFLVAAYSGNDDEAEVQPPQTHSIKITFGHQENIDDRFSIDVVPAIKSGKRKKDSKGEHDIYYVPEIQKMNKRRWQSVYEKNGEKMRWILSDPKTYIHLSQALNKQNPDFRKAAKFVKIWKKSCNAGLTDFELKSFHLELIVMEIFKNESHSNMVEALSEFFDTLKNRLDEPKIPDEADSNILVDNYLNDDKTNQRAKAVMFAGKTIGFFEEFPEAVDEDQLYTSLRKSLISTAPWGISVNCNNINITCLAEKREQDKLKQPVKPKRPSSNYYKTTIPRYVVNSSNASKILNSGQKFKPGYNLKFSSNLDLNNFDEIKWLIVNNGNDALAKSRIGGWRGNKFEECEAGTSERNEYTSYLGNHWVECFAIKDGICQQHGRFDVNISNYE